MSDLHQRLVDDAAREPVRFSGERHRRIMSRLTDAAADEAIDDTAVDDAAGRGALVAAGAVAPAAIPRAWRLPTLAFGAAAAAAVVVGLLMLDGDRAQPPVARSRLAAQHAAPHGSPHPQVGTAEPADRPLAADPAGAERAARLDRLNRALPQEAQGVARFLAGELDRAGSIARRG